MPLVWDNRKTYSEAIDRLEQAYISAAIDVLCKVGDEALKYAREKKGYVTRTGNLFNSTGYIVLHDGKVVKQRFDGNEIGSEPGGDMSMAHTKGYEYAISVGKKLPPKGAFLVWVAGMEYARYVEARGYDVIEGSGNWVEANAESIIQGLIKEVESKL